MHIDVRPVTFDTDRAAVTEFLASSRWPFHGPSGDADAGDRWIGTSSSIDRFWIVVDGVRVGLIALLDLDDIGDGAPMFDLRIAERFRRRGVGTAATQWIVDHLFGEHAACHRIEANTRVDNEAMRRVLTSVGFTHEGILRASWRGVDGGWFDTAVYGILRTEWSPPSLPEIDAS